MPARGHSLVSVMPAPHPPLRLVEPLAPIAPIESDSSTACFVRIRATWLPSRSD